MIKLTTQGYFKNIEGSVPIFHHLPERNSGLVQYLVKNEVTFLTHNSNAKRQLLDYSTILCGARVGLTGAGLYKT